LYEPRSFVLSWDEVAEPMAMFTPDFYLPEDKVFVEVTTMNQRLVTKKNRKVRLLGEIYPDVKCKILYQRDYLHLVVKYGLELPDQLTEGSLPTRRPGPPEVEQVPLARVVNG
jgi:hypothetical protein